MCLELSGLGPFSMNLARLDAFFALTPRDMYSLSEQARMGGCCLLILVCLETLFSPIRTCKEEKTCKNTHTQNNILSGF